MHPAIPAMTRTAPMNIRRMLASLATQADE
jgi:hypothetical protein